MFYNQKMGIEILELSMKISIYLFYKHNESF